VSCRKNGHFCWCCRRFRPNARFSGGNHRRHLCRECAHLPAEEREHRQGECDIERLLHDGLYVPRRRAQFSRFLDHPNARVRELAQRILAEQRSDADVVAGRRASVQWRGPRLVVPRPSMAAPCFMRRCSKHPLSEMKLEHASRSSFAAWSQKQTSNRKPLFRSPSMVGR